MAKFENTGTRYQQYANDFALDNKAQITRLVPIIKEFDGTTKVYFEVTFKEGRTYWPFIFFCKFLPTEEDITKLKEGKTKDLFLQWGRMSAEDDWGKPKVLAIVDEDGEEWQLQGEQDVYQGDEAGTV